MNNTIRISIVLAALCLVSIRHASAQAFLFTNFDPPGSAFTELWGINNWHMLAGNCFQCNEGKDASWLFDGAKFTFYEDSLNPFLSARSINDSGQVVGFYGPDNQHPVGYFRDLPAFNSFTPLQQIASPPNASTVQALGVNNCGVIVGQYFDTASHGFIGTLEGPLDTIPNVLNAKGISSKGWIVGRYDGVQSYLQKPDGSRTIFSAQTPDGTPPTRTIASGINSLEQVVGDYTAQSGHKFGYLWESSMGTGDPAAWVSFDVPGLFGTVPCKVCTIPFFGPGTQPASVNDGSSVVGLYADAIGNTHGFQLMIVHATYALVATSASCSAISLSGGSSVDSNIATNGG